MRYKPECPYVLKDISVRIEAGEKVGIVGRTGAGKSSLLQTLLRLGESYEGRILVDSVDISKLSVASLRGQVTTVPQEAVLFSGNLRENIDPLGLHSD
jgi:ATP-binding cassette subfamily C (CFTR/MRP) protein 1